jgi:hypothetical protein
LSHGGSSHQAAGQKGTEGFDHAKPFECRKKVKSTTSLSKWSGGNPWLSWIFYSMSKACVPNAPRARSAK